MKQITDIEEHEETYIIKYSDGTVEGYTPNAFELWLIKQIIAIKKKVGA